MELFEPLGHHAHRRVVAIDAPIAELTPHQVAQAVAVIEEPLFEDLLVQASRVEARRHRQFDIGDQRLLGRRGQDAVGQQDAP